jgi:hypothetical protein
MMDSEEKRPLLDGASIALQNKKIRNHVSINADNDQEE